MIKLSNTNINFVVLNNMYMENDNMENHHDFYN